MFRRHCKWQWHFVMCPSIGWFSQPLATSGGISFLQSRRPWVCERCHNARKGLGLSDSLSLLTLNYIILERVLQVLQNTLSSEKFPHILSAENWAYLQLYGSPSGCHTCGWKSCIWCRRMLVPEPDGAPALWAWAHDECRLPAAWASPSGLGRRSLHRLQEFGGETSDVFPF